ncbi:MAG TPA: hypothetical protein VNV41_13215 [Candidatus Acidoferrales bacterium]|jgi:hypothetical protein|nr:hypothetical protein [Candidatus Acidoferrales bacterium]
MRNARFSFSVSVILLCLISGGCSKPWHKTSLVYIGFDDHSEKSAGVIELTKVWSSSPPCPDWRVTIDPKKANYLVLIGNVDVTIMDDHGRVIYHGGQAVMYDGNTDASGTDICKLTGE